MFWDAVARFLALMLNDFFFLYFPGPGSRRVRRIHKEARRDG